MVDLTPPLPRNGSPLRFVLEELADGPAAILPYEASRIRVTTRSAVASFCEPWRTEPQRAGGLFMPKYDHVFILQENVRRRILGIRSLREGKIRA